MNELFAGIAFGVGVALALLALVVYGHLNDTMQHNVGWHHAVCVATGMNDYEHAADNYRLHCTTGDEIARWLQSIGR